MSNSLHAAPPSRPRRESSHSALARTRRRALIAFVIGSVVAAWPVFAPAADTWPSRPVRIIVPFPPGGPADGTARVLAEVMSPSLGQPIVVENKTGGGGVVGITAAAHSNDGHTLLMGSTSMVITPSLQPKLTYDVLRDFDPVGMVSAQPLLIVVPASSSIKSFADFGGVIFHSASSPASSKPMLCRIVMRVVAASWSLGT